MTLPASDRATHDGATMIETVARAICREEHLMRYGTKVWREGELDAKVDAYWPQHVSKACAAITAMREPTQEMLRDAWDDGGLPTDDGVLAAEQLAGKVWQAMIDAALATRTSEPRG